MPNRNIVAAGLLASAASLVLACGSGGRTTPPATTSQTTSLILSSIVPNQGTTGGGTKVTVHGAGFAGGAQVTFGGTPGLTTFMSSQKLEAIVPPHSSGVVDVTVTNSNGAASTMRGSFTFVDPPFNDVTQESGIDFLCLGGEQIIKVACGALAADFDNDGFQDLFVASFAGSNGLFMNGGDGTFRGTGVSAGVALPASNDNGACAGDFDNDGWVDLYVTAYGQDHLFHNDGNGTFTDVTFIAGLGSDMRGTGCAWGDYDNDGLLDLIVANYIREEDPSIFETRNFAIAAGRVLIYHNEGGTGFLEVGPDLIQGNSLIGAGFGASFIDYDQDGRLDIYVFNDFGAEFRPNALLHNEGPDGNGQWSFLDVSDPTGAGVGIFAMGLALGDYDRNGLIDLYITNMGANVLLQQLPDHSFGSVAFQAGVDRPKLGGLIQVGWGTFFFDYDNDGWLDLYVVDGFLDSAKERNFIEQPNGLYRNKRDGTFEEVSVVSGIDHPGVGRGGLYLDYDNDGWLDVFVANMDEPSRLYRNVGGGANWLRVETRAATGNRQGIGARIEMHSGNLVQIEEVRSGSSHMSGNMLACHFGLGQASVAEMLEVHWPSGKVQRFFEVPANQTIVVEEPAP